jgi:hypothetical protein
VARSWRVRQHDEVLTDADAFEQLRVVEVTGPVGSVCLFSDGLERLVLDFRTRTRAAGSA